MFVKSTRFKQVCQLLLSLIEGILGYILKPWIILRALGIEIITRNYFCHIIEQQTQTVPRSVNLPVTGQIHNNKGV